MHILAAPLQEYTCAPFRLAHARAIGGVDEYYMPFARLEKGQVPRRAAEDLMPERNAGCNSVPQILVRDGEETRRLVEYVLALGYRRIDFNFGCPFPKLTSRGYGAGILAEPAAVSSVLESARQYADVGFSAKMRLGLTSPDDAFALLPLLNGFPFVQLVLHPRTAAQQYSGIPDRDAFLRFRDKCHHPLFYNGDIVLPENAAGLDAVMAGRGLLAMPDLPLRLRGQEPPAGCMEAFHREFVLETRRLCRQPLQSLKLLWNYFLPDAGKKARKALAKAKTMDEYLEISAAIFRDREAGLEAAGQHGSQAQ